MTLVEAGPKYWPAWLNSRLLVISKAIISNARTKKDIKDSTTFIWESDGRDPVLTLDADFKKPLLEQPRPFIERADLGVNFPDIGFVIKISDATEGGLNFGPDFADPVIGSVVLDCFNRYYIENQLAGGRGGNRTLNP